MSNKADGAVAEKPSSNVSEKNKWHLDCLLERLRQQQQNKTFLELSKSVRMSLLEKRFAMDVIEKANLQKTLDNLQHYIQVKNVSRSWLVERLDSLSRQLGLKFNIDNGLFISSDMFFIEINLNVDDTVKEVNVHHEGVQEHYPCKELVTAISKGDFVDLTSQLEGLISIYQINAEKSVKCKAFVALQALETDLAHFSLLQASMTKDNYQMCMHSPLGLLQKRRGGHPMQITYFVSAYDLIDTDKKQLITQLTHDLINTKKIGCSVTVNLEASAATRLQIQPLLSISPDAQGCNTPVYATMSSNNSMLLPATFVLKLNKPTPVCRKLVDLIENITEQKLACNKNCTPLMVSIAQTASDGIITSVERGLFVSLPDQCHCYFLTDTKEAAMLVSSIPFSDPQHVPKVIQILRQQALFNTLISSCIRTNSIKDYETMQIFEVNALSHQHITISLEHPYQQQLTTIEFDLTDIGSIECTIYCGTQMSSVANKIAKVMQTCMSIPVTMRYLMKAWHQEYARVNLRKFDSDSFNMSLESNEPGGEEDEYDPLAPNSNDNEYLNGRFSNGNNGSNGDRMTDSMEKYSMRNIKSDLDSDMFDESNNSCDSYSLGSLENITPNPGFDYEGKDMMQEPLAKKLKTEISITPISTSNLSTASGVSLDRRPGIEIIPISSANAKDLPASITITPINSIKPEKKSSNCSSDGQKPEKKKKRKREESPMGPPDPLSKPVSVSLHCLASGSSPIHRSGGSSSSSASSAKQSPKHSPAHSASPKHQGLTSPKHSISSPKHPSGASSGGKPSMSALKSAANSPKTSSNPLQANNSSNSNISLSQNTDNGDKSSPSSAQVKNRKGSLTAVIDKLKSNAQSPEDVFLPAQSPSPLCNTHASPHSTNPNPSSNNNGSSNTSINAPIQSSSTSSSSKTSSEYMVKHSSDGMKITINKTKSKDKSNSGLTKSASFSSGSNSPKTHTGLKPGVNSGPASKKPSISSSSKSSSGSSSQKLPFQKSSSSGNLSSSGKLYSPSKSSSSSNSSNTSKDRIKSSKSSSSSEKYRPEHPPDIMKMLGFSSSVQGNENFMKSSKFQIPKISARTSNSTNQCSTNSLVDDYRKEKASLSAPNTPSTSSGCIDTSPKMLPDFGKYPMTFSAATKLPGDISPMHVPSATSALSKISVSSSPKYNTQADTREAMNLETYHSNKLNSMPISFPSPLHHSSETNPEKSIENVKRSSTPSHSVYATVHHSPSPLIIIPSPRSNENITDDDNLMEELVGITK